MMGVLLQKKKNDKLPSICNILSRPLHMNNNLDHLRNIMIRFYGHLVFKNYYFIKNHTSMVYRFKKNIYSNL